MASTDSINRIVSQFHAKKTSEKPTWRGCCPICKHESLIIESGDKAPVVAWCARDCDKAAVNRAVYAFANIKREPFTLARFCEIKKLPPEWVSSRFGVHDSNFRKKDGSFSKTPAVCFPYFGEARVTIDGKHEHYERNFGGFKFRFSENSHKTAWQDYTTAMLYGLGFDYKREGIDASVVVLCEGESDTITLAYFGIPALGIPGAPYGWKDDFASATLLQNAKKILLVREPDEAGRKLLEKVVTSLPPGKLYSLQLPAKDPSELWLQSKSQEEFVAAWQQAVEAAQPVGPLRDYVVEKMSSITPKPITWLWPGRVPKGKITVFAGNPGTAKSLVTCSLAAIVSMGGTFPDALTDQEPMDVLMFFCEDDAADTVVPRLMAAGANLDRVLKIKTQSIGPDATRAERELAFDTDRKLLEKFLKENPRVKLVIVDPISSYVGNIKPNDEKELRAVLVPIADLAQRTGVTFVLVAHFNKRSDVSAIHKVLGAVAMTGVARSAWLFAEDQDSPESQPQRYLMLQGKMNVGRKQKGLQYTIGEKQILEKPADPTPFIEWGCSTDVTAEKALGSVGAFKDKNGSMVQRAGEFLREFLSDGDKPAKDCFTEATARGIGERTLKSAKAELLVESHKILGQWMWHLPDDDSSGGGSLEQQILHP